MNAIISRTAKLAHAAPISGPGDALARCLSPFAQLQHDVPRVVKLAGVSDHCDRWMTYVEDPFRISHKRRERAVELLTRIPSRDRLVDLQDGVAELLARPASPPELGVLTAVLQSSVVDGDSDKAQARADMLPRVLSQHHEPLSAPVVAAVVLAWLAREKFMPAICDFLTECTDQRIAVRVHTIGIDRLLALRVRLETIIDAIGDQRTMPEAG